MAFSFCLCDIHSVISWSTAADVFTVDVTDVAAADAVDAGHFFEMNLFDLSPTETKCFR